MSAEPHHHADGHAQQWELRTAPADLGWSDLNRAIRPGSTVHPASSPGPQEPDPAGVLRASLADSFILLAIENVDPGKDRDGERFIAVHHHELLRAQIDPDPEPLPMQEPLLDEIAHAACQREPVVIALVDGSRLRGIPFLPHPTATSLRLYPGRDENPYAVRLEHIMYVRRPPTRDEELRD